MNENSFGEVNTEVMWNLNAWAGPGQTDGERTGGSTSWGEYGPDPIPPFVWPDPLWRSWSYSVSTNPPRDEWEGGYSEFEQVDVYNGGSILESLTGGAGVLARVYAWAREEISGVDLAPSQILLLGKTPDVDGYLIASLADHQSIGVEFAGVSVPFDIIYDVSAVKLGELVIKAGGENVSGLTRTVSVGENIHLTADFTDHAAALPPNTPITYLWTVPGYGGTAISNYFHENGILGVPFPLTNSSVSFYWTDKFDEAEVTCTATFTLNGETFSLTASTKFVVTKPQNYFIGLTTWGGPQVSTNCPPFPETKWALHYGKAIPNQAGIEFLFNNDQAKWGIIQILENFKFRAHFGTFGWFSYQPTNIIHDKSVLPAPQGWNDSPNVVLPPVRFNWDNPGFDYGDSTEYGFRARTWLMFNPAPNSPTGIWVPIMQLTWQWKGEAEPDPSPIFVDDWWLIPGSGNHIPNPVGIPTTAFPPTWSMRFSDIVQPLPVMPEN